MTTVSPTPLYREVPDPQVLGTAREYDTAFFALIELGPGAGVLLPALHCGALALDLFPKAWTAHQVEVLDEDDLGVTIYADVDEHAHGLAERLQSTPEEFQKNLHARFRATPCLESIGSAGEVLKGFEGLFVASRYPYEP